MSFTQRLPFVPRALVAVMSAVLMLLVGMSHAWAQSSEPVSTGALQSPTVEADEELDAGELVTLSGTGFAPGGQIDIVIESDPVHLGTAHADAAGAFEFAVRIPTGLPAGDHTLKATGPDPTGGLRVLSIPVKIADATQAGSSGNTVAGLPVTGATAVPLAASGVAAVALGVLLVRRTRRAA